MRKARDLLVITLIYVFAFAVGFFFCEPIENIILKFFVFDSVATVATFVFSVLLKNSSVYDAYWSLTPMFMSIWLFAITRAFSPLQIAFLVIFNIWSLRLTINWITVFTDFTYEDWRYRKYREETPKIFWPIVNFFGIHYMPTIVVFLGMLPLFEIVKGRIGIFSLNGMAVMLLGIGFEFFADRQMHRFLNESKTKSVCKEGLWRYSRHPNYLGEITFWVGTFLCMIPYAIDKWCYSVGFISIAILFNVVSIPLMENRQKSRREEYVQYIKETSKLLILPFKK